MTEIIRAYFKPKGSNPEIKGPFYELSSYALVRGDFNCEVLTLGYSKGKSITSMLFRPIDLKKPIVLAVDNSSDVVFVFLDHHVEDNAEAGMRNYKQFQTDDFIVDCKRGESGRDSYWSVTSEGLTFVYGEVTFPETWHLRDCDLLCAFVGGELTANQLRMHAYLADREAVKEERREAHIERLTHELREAVTDASTARHDHDRLIIRLELAMETFLPFVNKRAILEVIE